jgi:phosphoadenosine phosphosulfate reductase
MKQLRMDGFEPTEQEIVDDLLAQPLKQKIEHSINLLKSFEGGALKRDPENGFQFGFSGGKDSVVCKQLLIEAGVKYKPSYNYTTIDPPELVEFIKEHHPEVEWNIQEDKGHLILDRMVEKMSMPTRLGKWCCSEYKDCCSKSDTVGVVGVRIEESARRAGLWKEFTKHSKTGRYILAPICYWTQEDVWEYIKDRKLPYCKLYDEGWDRLGCVGCPINPKSQEKEFERYPEYKEMWMEGCRRMWEKAQTTLKKDGTKYAVGNFESPEALFKWWVKGKKDEEEPNCVFEEMMENK